MNTFSKLAVGSALVLSLAGGAVWAHGPGAGMGSCAGEGYGRHGAMAGDHAARMDAHLAYIKSSLKITPDQETAWKTFEAAVKSQALSAPRGPGDRSQTANLSAPERADAHAKFVQERAKGAQVMAQAVKDLYAKLTPEQKTTADRVLGGHQGRHFG